MSDQKRSERALTSQDLAKTLMDFAVRCRKEHGFVLPMTVVAVGANGSVIAFRALPGADNLQILVDHQEDGHFKLPVNALYTDAKGEAARGLISSEGTSKLVDRK